MSEEIIIEETEQQPEVTADRKLALTVTFTVDGVRIDVSSNLSPLEQLGAIEIFKAHLLTSSLGDSKQ